MTDYELINNALYEVLQKEYPEQCERVFNSHRCDIDPTFLGFVYTYYHLSKLIPKYFMVVDLGCAFSPQGYYFTDHKKYIGVDVGESSSRFSFGNTEHIVSTINDYLENYASDPLDAFAICNYVPLRNYKTIGHTFPNLYVFYPHGGSLF